MPPPVMPSLAPPIPAAHLRGRAPHAFDLAPDTECCARIAAFLGVDVVRAFRFAGALRPAGGGDWELSATLGATVVQPCVVTRAPVTTRIDTQVTRRFVADWHDPEGDDVEMPADDTQEPLGSAVDIGAAAVEALALALPDWPRAPGAALGDAGMLQAAPPGESPLQDGDLKPFAGLAALRARLDGS